ncbi:MAG: nitroreductase family protein [Ilumatobacteraceae bacterium]
MRLNLSADEVLATTRSVRKRLDFDKPVEREIVMECLELALQAPTGSNAQGWQWVFVEDQAKKDALAEIYRTRFEMYRTMPRATYDDGDTRAERMDAVVDSASFLSDHFEQSPIMMIPCIKGRVDPEGGSGSGAGMWGSLLPAVWSMMLALRERGIGSAWTTLHLLGDGEQQAADLLGIPDGYTQAGLFPIAYTVGTDFKPAKRVPAAELTHWDHW